LVSESCRVGIKKKEALEGKKEALKVSLTKKIIVILYIHILYHKQTTFPMIPVLVTFGSQTGMTSETLTT